MSALFPERIETDRLELVAAGPDAVDVHELYRICAADDGIEAVTEYVTWEPHPHPKETQEFLEFAAEQRAEGESAQYAVRPREGEDGAGEIAGLTALTPDWERDLGELGIWLRRRFWGRGYAGERAAELLRVAFERLDLSVVAVSHLEGNERSRRAVERYVAAHGGRHEGHLRNARTAADGTPVDVLRYTVSRAEYRDAT